MAMAEDIRVIIIKFADRMHNLSTLEYMSPQKQRDKAVECLEVYAPIAHRLGIRTVKEYMEDVSLKYLDPLAYREIEDDLASRSNSSKQFIEDTKALIRSRVEVSIPDVYIEGRVKSVYGIYRKMFIQGKAFDEIYDVFAVRVIVDTIEDCYNVLGIIHDMFQPLPNRFKDYISMPKPNMYQSLHTTVITKAGVPFEVQIRTWEMHHTAEYGIAAHWKYKLGMSAKDSDNAALDDRLAWIRQMLENQAESEDVTDLVHSIKSDLIPEEVFVFTPRGDVINLPLGSTVIDFAYAIHSAVGNRMIGAKVDKRIVPLDYKVKTGEIIEILTTKEAGKGPNRDWLTLVRTSEARNKIRAWFKKEKRDENIVEGKAELEREFKRSNIQLTRELTDYLHSLDNTRPVTCGINIFFNFLSSIGFGVYSDEKAKKEAEKAEKLRAAGVQPQKKKAVGSKFFNDLAGLMGDEFMKRGATLHGCDVRTRDAFANMDIAGYNYGIYRYKHDLKKYPNRLILGSETFCNDAYRFREQAKKNPRLVGDFVWAGMDYLGEVGVGSWEYKAYATQFSGLGWTTAGSGRIDLNGRPLGEALYTRVALEQEIGPYIAVRPVMFSGEKHSPSAWKMTDAMPSWSWAGCEGKKAHIEVYARAAKVALLLNGKKVAEKQLKNDCLAKFTIPYQSGTLEAVSYDAIDRVLGRCKLQTAGADTVLRAVPEEKKTKPGRLCYIRIRYTDRAGELKPMERGMVNITVSGGKLLAAGSACPFHPGSYLTPETDTYYGEALAVVEAGESGAVEVSISDGERSDTVKIPIA